MTSLISTVCEAINTLLFPLSNAITDNWHRQLKRFVSLQTTAFTSRWSSPQYFISSRRRNSIYTNLLHTNTRKTVCQVCS